MASILNPRTATTDRPLEVWSKAVQIGSKTTTRWYFYSFAAGRVMPVARDLAELGLAEERFVDLGAKPEWLGR